MHVWCVWADACVCMYMCVCCDAISIWSFPGSNLHALTIFSLLLGLNVKAWSGSQQAGVKMETSLNLVVSELVWHADSASCRVCYAYPKPVAKACPSESLPLCWLLLNVSSHIVWWVVSELVWAKPVLLWVKMHQTGFKPLWKSVCEAVWTPWRILLTIIKEAQSINQKKLNGWLSFPKARLIDSILLSKLILMTLAW